MIEGAVNTSYAPTRTRAETAAEAEREAVENSVAVRDFSVYATQLHGKPGTSEAQRALIGELVQVQVANPEQFENVWQEHVYALNGQYQMMDS
jgi:hypothetical protein